MGYLVVALQPKKVNQKIPFELKSLVEQNLTTSGFGLTAAIGIGPVWIVVDDNISWSKP